MATIQVKEYDLLKFKKPGLIEQSLASKQVETLKRVDSTLDASALRWEYNGVRFNHHCGVIALGKDAIEILPKIHGIESTNEMDLGASRKILIKMLAQTHKLKTPHGGRSGIDVQKHQLLDVFIDNFCTELFHQIHQGVIKTYVNREGNLNVVKGRLMIKEQLRHNLVHKERFYCQYNEFIEDNNYNQVIKATLRHLFGRVTNNKLKRNLSELINVFDSVTDSPKVSVDVDRLPRNRMVNRYNGVFAMCRMFLAGVSPDVITGKHEALSLLFNMNELFEEFIAHRIKKVTSRMDLEALAQKPQRYLASCKIHGKDMFKMKPDITIRNKTDQILAIIDTKWKLLNPKDAKYGISQADMYQMHAYATQYKCKDIILLYPYHNGTGKKLPHLVVNVGEQRIDEQRIRIKTVDLSKLASKSLESFDKQLISIIEEAVM